MAEMLTKKEFVINPTSTASVADELTDAFVVLNSLQDAAQDWMGGYVEYFCADMYDSRTGIIYRMYSDAARDHFSMGGSVFVILNPPNLLKLSDTEDNPDLDVAPGKLISRGGLSGVFDEVLTTSRLVRNKRTIHNNRITISYYPSGSIVGKVARVYVGKNTYDEVTVTQSGKTIILHPKVSHEYDGLKAEVTYLTNLDEW